MGGGHPPILLSFFGQNHILLRGGGVTPNSAKEKSAKNSYFWPKSPYLPFFKRFSVQGGGRFAKFFLAKYFTLGGQRKKSAK